MKRRMIYKWKSFQTAIDPEWNDKLVFVGLSPSFLSLRDQSEDWSWQSPG